jgi:MoxR-like ATPase
MLPITFDHHVLHSLPSVDDAAAARVVHLLHTIAVHRVVPHLAARDDADATRLARAADRTTLVRLEDPDNQLDLVSLVTSDERHWSIHIHERIFDYFAFAFPVRGDSDEELTSDARRALALAEFILRHQLHHLTYPEQGEVAVISADLEFVAERRLSDPPYFKHLVGALTDDTTGIRAHGYLDLFERASESRDALRGAIRQHVREHLCHLCNAPPELLQRVFAAQGSDERHQLVVACLRQGHNPDLPITRRAAHILGTLTLLDAQRTEDDDGFRKLLGELRQRGLLAGLLTELGLDPEPDPLEEPSAWRRLQHAVRGRVAILHPTTPDPAPDTPGAESPQPTLDGPVLMGEEPRLTLKERVERARRDPRVPAAVLDAIDSNESNLQGHSKAKYTEFITTLLSLPWGRIQALDVGPREFSLGLDQSHYGLDRPKNLVGDFFANLLWRYRSFRPEDAASWARTGSAFLFVGPPGVGKTSLAISIAHTLGIPYHKISLGGLRDESALRGHGFTYEGSKPGAIVQGLIKMGAMNGMFILDEADKTEPFAIATLLEILDPEQNHLFHDKYTLSTVDIDLSNCHFILTANTLDTVPAPVLDRCQVIELGRYSIEEKIRISREHLLPRLRAKHDIPDTQIAFETGAEDEHLRMIIRDYTHEAGVRQLDLTLRSLLLRAQRRLVFEGDRARVVLDHNTVRDMLDEPILPRRVQPEDLVGEVAALGVNPERGIGSLLPIQVTAVPGAASEGSVSVLHATGNLEKVMDESRKVATTAILHNAEALGVDPERLKTPFHLHVMGSSSKKDGPSAGLAIALAMTSQLTGRAVRRDVAATGEIGTRGRVTGIGGLDVKLETAIHAGCTTLLIPHENLRGPGGIASLPEALRKELQVLEFDAWRQPHPTPDLSRQVLQVVAVEHLLQAWQVARVDPEELAPVEASIVAHARAFAQDSSIPGDPCPPAVVVKQQADVADYGQSDLCPDCPGCHLIVPLDMDVPAVATAFGASVQAHSGDDLAARTREAVEARLASRGLASVVAPYFVLREAGLTEARDGVTVIASNWLADGRKLRSHRSLVHRLACRLLKAGPAHLDSCPLLKRVEGVWALSLAGVPEKYRLDPGRSGELAGRLLGAWLEAASESIAAVEEEQREGPYLLR